MGFFGKDKPEEKSVPETPKPETPKAETPRKRTRRGREEVARARLVKGQKMVEDAKRVIAEIEKAKLTKERKARLFPAAGMLLKIIDDYKLPDGITDSDFVAALRMVLAWLRPQDGEEKSSWKKRVSPVFTAIFANGQAPSPAQNAAFMILTCNSKACEIVEALRPKPKPKKKGKTAPDTETPAADTETPAGQEDEKPAGEMPAGEDETPAAK